MTAYTVPSGIASYSNTLGAAGAADSITFADRYGYMAITNLSATGPVYVTSNGIAPADSNGEDGSTVVPAGQTVLVANGGGYWGQVQNALVAGSIQVGNGKAYNASTNPSLPSQPGTVYPYGSSLAGQGQDDPDPGIVIGIICANPPFTTSPYPTYVITAAG